MVIIPTKPTTKKTTTKKPTTTKPSLKVKLTSFLKNGKDWQVKHYGVSDIIKIQILPENKTNPRRLGIFITTQGRDGRKGVRITNKETYILVSESLLHEKTAEIVGVIESINPSAENPELASDEL